MTRYFIIPRRNDLAGINLQFTDLKPNAGQRNSTYDGEPQNHYIAEPLDQAGTTVVSGTAYVSGPLNTTLTADAVADDTTGGGNDVTAMAATSFGLASYLKDRCQFGGTALATAPQMTFADANTIATNIIARVEAGNTLLLADINTLLSATAADTDLDGADPQSRSFGLVTDILRILGGEVYRLPALTIIEDVANEFQTLAARQVLVDAQTPVFVAAQGQFVASGGFLAATDSGFRAKPLLVRNGALNISASVGVLAGYKAAVGITVLNRNFAYAAGDVTVIRPRAFDIAGNAIAATGIHPALAIYDVLGNII